MLALAQGVLCALLFSCIFVPRFSVGPIIPFYQIAIRMEDVFLLISGILTWGLVARGPSLPGSPSVTRAFLWFLVAAQISILNGLIFRTIDKPILSFLYLVKWVEYLVVFLLAMRLTQDRQDAILFLKVFFLLGIAIASFGYWEYFFPSSKAVYPNYYRLFERPPFHGDANHIGGLLVLWMGFFTSLFLKEGSRSRQALLLTALIFVFFPFLWTYSRKSYFALTAAFAFAFLFRGSRKKLLFLVCLLMILGLALPTRVSERLIDLREAFASTDPFHSSWATNWVMWKESLWNFQQFFLLGSGWGSRHRLFYESQYIQILAETGLLGLAAFVLLCFSLVREMIQNLGKSLGSEEQGWVFGWFIGFVGLLIHNASCVSLTASKIAIPFWFLTAVVLRGVHRQTSLSP